MKKYIRTCPELGDGDSHAIYRLEEVPELGKMIVELINSGDFQVGETFTLEVIELSDEAFEALPEL